MTMPATGTAGRGLALGAWGAAQATAAGLSIAIGGAGRDWVNALATQGHLGEALNTPATGYSVIYHAEIGLLFITLVVLGPLVRTAPTATTQPDSSTRLGLADFPA
jgi:BCD family chlorophyll transporter-like MFS transporter